MKNLWRVKWVKLSLILLSWVTITLLIPAAIHFSLPVVPFHGFQLHTDYLVHFLIFAMLTAAASLANLHIKPVILFPVFLAIAALVEVCQLKIPSRTYNPYDLVCNLAGVAFSLVVFYKRFKNHHSD